MSIARLLVTWLVLAVVMTLNGTFRVFFLEPRLGAATAGWISLAMGLVLILAVTRIAFRIPRGYPTAPLLLAGLVLVVLTIAFELAIGVLLGGRTWGDVLRTYAFWQGEPWPAVLVILGLTPLIWRGKSGETRRA